MIFVLLTFQLHLKLHIKQELNDVYMQIAFNAADENDRYKKLELRDDFFSMKRAWRKQKKKFQFVKN